MRRRVVIADDQEDMRMLMRMVFVGHGWTVVAEAKDGLEAIGAWEQEKVGDVGLVVLDQQMPGLTGIEVAEQILADNPDQQIVIVSAYITDDVRARALVSGVLACVDKKEIMGLPSSALITA